MRTFLAIPLAIIFCGCGDGVISGDFQGNPMIVVSGLVCGDAAPKPVVSARVGILWKQHDDVRRTWTINAVAPIDAKFPTLFDMPVYDPPPDGTSQTFVTDGGEITAGLGCPVVFDDRDLDETYSAGDALVAISWDQLILYKHGDGAAEGAFSGLQRFIGSEALAPGYQIVSGVCEPGHRSETLAPTNPDRRQVNINVLEEMNPEPVAERDRFCVSFF